jgi:hypothetical protein
LIANDPLNEGDQAYAQQTNFNRPTSAWRWHHWSRQNLISYFILIGKKRIHSSNKKIAK